MDKTLYCWSCGHAGHAKNDCISKKIHDESVGNRKRKSIVSAKVSIKESGNHLPKLLKCFYCGWNNHAVENYFALHPDKCPSSKRKRRWRRRLASWRRGSRIWRHPAKSWTHHLSLELALILPLQNIID